ncbi:MAG: NusG domain II-containing protein [Oscillospiraceae bacterium]|nr:NusG domain II-containing protein [Oscillospiraceae bacterium]
MLKTRTWVLILAGAACALALLSALLLLPRRGGTVAQVLRDGEVLREINLDTVTVPYSFTVEAPGGGGNTVEVAPGRIRVSEADCPDRVCVGMGWLSAGEAAPVVCLPHRLVLRLRDAAEVDAAAR